MLCYHMGCCNACIEQLFVQTVYQTHACDAFKSLNNLIIRFIGIISNQILTFREGKLTLIQIFPDHVIMCCVWIARKLPTNYVLVSIYYNNSKRVAKLSLNVIPTQLGFVKSFYYLQANFVFCPYNHANEYNPLLC